MKKQSFRAFFAIDIPEDIKKAIITATKPLHTYYSLSQIKWVKPENWHITLCFLNTISEQQYQCLDKKIKIALKSITSFHVELKSLQPFPSAEKFHIINLRPEPQENLTKLALIIEQNVKTCGIQTENRPFIPHLTLGRINNNQHKIQPKFLDKIALPTMNFDIIRLKLFKSEPQPTGSLYTPVSVYDFC